MGTKYKGTKKEVNALNSLIKITRAADSIRSRVQSTIGTTEITESQFYVLDALYHASPLTQKNIGEKVFRSGGNITLVIDNLEKQGYVLRVRGKEDRRYFNIHLTKAGRKIMDRLFPKFLKAVIDEMNRLSDEEHKELQRLSKKIGLKS
ncbi:MAG: MarR family transcriptional regulator [Ignavibacteria bacterium GWA2_35_9]|nr:MAG: MarR family transcriptional regulator [Ignavibacteria bacterium GWA2_35_9]